MKYRYIIVFFIFFILFANIAHATIPPTPISLTNTTGNFWVNYTWLEGNTKISPINITDATTNDSDISTSPADIEDTTVWYYSDFYVSNLSGATVNCSVSTAGTGQTAYIQAYNVSTSGFETIDSHSGAKTWRNSTIDPKYINASGYVKIRVNEYYKFIVPTPRHVDVYEIQVYHINHTDSFNVSQNGTWTNGTTNTYINSTVGAHGYSDIIVYAYNSSGNGNLSSTYLTDNVTVPNNAPVVSNVTITPGAPIDTDDLTANNDTATDGDGDNITLYYRWYKNNVIQTSLNNLTTVLFDNTTAGESWILGIIPNDGYENGTQVNSSAVTIDSIFTFTNENVNPQTIEKGDSSEISIDVTSTGGSISTVSVKIDGINHTMTNTEGDTWNYTLIGSSIKTYYITNYYATDAVSNSDSTTSDRSVKVIDSPGPPKPTPKPTMTPTPTVIPPPVEPPVEPPKTIIEKIFSIIPFFLFMLVAYFGAFIVAIILNISNIEKLSVGDVLLFGTLSWISILLINIFIDIFAMGLVTYLLFFVFAVVFTLLGYAIQEEGNNITPMKLR